MKDAKRFWDESAEKCIRRALKDVETYQKKLAMTRRVLKPDSKVLEFGCGSGATALVHAPFVKYIVATDISEKMIEAAERKSLEEGADNISFQCGTLESLNFKDADFDAVLGLNVLHLLEDVDGAVSQVYRLLKPGGVFVSSTSLIAEINRAFRCLISGMQALGLAPYVSRFTKDQLVSKLLSVGFTIEHEWRSSRESVFIIARKGPPHGAEPVIGGCREHGDDL